MISIIKHQQAKIMYLGGGKCLFMDNYFILLIFLHFFTTFYLHFDLNTSSALKNNLNNNKYWFLANCILLLISKGCFLNT